MFGGMALATAILVYKPDTRRVHTHWLTLADFRSIQTWALEEAKARMEARGDRPQYKPS